MDELVPEAFLKVKRKKNKRFLFSHRNFQLQNSNYVNNWAVEIQNGVFDMVNLLVDLIAARLSYSPIPVRLLETLAILFNCDTVFQKKHRTKPYDRSLYHKQLGERVLASPPSTSTFAIYGHNDPYGWLCEIINRFVFKDGIVHLKRQFQTDRPLTSRVKLHDVFFFFCFSNRISSFLFRNSTPYWYLLWTVWNIFPLINIEIYSVNTLKKRSIIFKI